VIRTFVIATNNAGKLAEMRAILKSLEICLVSLKDAGINSEPDETGTTFKENAIIKARCAMESSGLPAIADDSGLVVDSLGGEPGINSARYGGILNKSDTDRVNFLLTNMYESELRSARFVSCIACVFPEGDIITAEGVCEGTITRHPIGDCGFGYDPVFVPDGFNLTFAQMPFEIKNRISHRAMAVNEFKKKLELRMKENTYAQQ